MRLYNLFIAIILPLQFIVAQKTESEPYTWKNVRIVGGGFVDGIVFHPKAKDVCYARTDMGGAYRRDAKSLSWEPLMDWVSYEDMNLMGVESIALDPQDPQMLFLACGTYTNIVAPNAILISNNYGKTFTRVDVPFRMGGNENGRGNGERMAVDPLNGKIIYMGTRHDGLWRSVDRGQSWNKVESFPDVTEQPEINNDGKPAVMGSGIIFVLFETDLGKKSTIYAGVSLMNRESIFRSTDDGKTWQPLSDQPLQLRPTHAALSSNGFLYITYGNSPGPSKMTAGEVWKLNTQTGQWTDITPEKIDPKNKKGFGYAAVAVDELNPNTLIVTTFSKGKDGDLIYRSQDGGKTWRSIFGSNDVWDRAKAPYTVYTPLHWMFDVEIDPFNPNHALFTTGYGGWETFNLTDADNGKPLTWSIMSYGIEETVALDLCSPAKGAQLFTAIGDYCGYRHEDLDRPVPEGCFTSSHMSNINSITCAELNPDVVIRAGRHSWHQKGKNFSYSLDGGIHWNEPDSVPSDRFLYGFVACSADGTSWIWTPEKEDVYRTADHGATWTKVSGLPKNTRVIADRVNSMKFYALQLFEGKLYISTDGGQSFTEKSFVLPDGLPIANKNRGDDRGGQDKLYATPAKEGDLWIAAFNGLYHSQNSGDSFLRTPFVSEVHAFGFGKAAPNAISPALYIVGVVNGLRGIFRSNDAAKTWIRINDDAHQWGLILQITGDPKKYGRVYVGTHGRGTIYGDPISSDK
jgi:photosystem II stability/assembly factor-like uncharacterized protein